MQASCEEPQTRPEVLSGGEGPDVRGVEFGHRSPLIQLAFALGGDREFVGSAELFADAPRVLGAMSGEDFQASVAISSRTSRTDASSVPLSPSRVVLVIKMSGR